MVIDCETCIARPRACGDCVVTHLLGVRDTRGHPFDRTGRGGQDPVTVSLDDAEVVAVATMAAAGLLPPLRLVSATVRGGRLPSLQGGDAHTMSDNTPLRAIG